jgi:hypothetical protein
MASERVRKAIERFAALREQAAAEGLQVRPSVDGPYLFDPASQRVVKRDWFNSRNPHDNQHGKRRTQGTSEPRSGTAEAN